MAKKHSMDVFNRSPEEWKGWNEWRGNRNDFTRDKVFCLIPDHTKVDTYFFAGIFEIKRQFDDWQETDRGYEMKLSNQFKDLIGKLEVKFYRYPGLLGRPSAWKHSSTRWKSYRHHQAYTTY